MHRHGVGDVSATRTRLSTPMTFSSFDLDEPAVEAGSKGCCNLGEKAAVRPCKDGRWSSYALCRKARGDCAEDIEPRYLLYRAAAVGLFHEAFQRPRIFVCIGHSFSLGDWLLGRPGTGFSRRPGLFGSLFRFARHHVSPRNSASEMRR
jgi:hypothetical protein